jgi:hypothetical protein
MEDEVRYSLPLGVGTGAAESDIIAASERQRCSFRVSDRDPNLEYTISIGDGIAESTPFEELVEPNETVSKAVWWREEAYFESGVGVVFATLFSRPLEEEEWTRLASLRINVLPSKIGFERYKKMFEDVSSLSASLVFDLVSKNTRNLSFRAGGIAFEPSNVQLRRIEETWLRVSPALQRIEALPATRIERKAEQTSDVCLLNGRSMAAALSRGFQPRYSTSRFTVFRSTETSKMYEHDLILTFLTALTERLAECRRYANELHEEIRSSYPTFFTPEITADVVARDIEPRLAKLQEMMSRCERQSVLIHTALDTNTFRNARTISEFKDSPILRNAKPYNAVFREIVDFRNKSSWSLDTGQQERIKLTSRLYEHWLFIQVAAALRRLGFVCTSSKGFFREGKHHRFILDIERGTELMFRLGARTLLRLRYEPWVLPRDQAVRAREFVFAPQRDPWNPDITMEFFRARNDGEPEVLEYMAVIDAKYSHFPSRSQREKVGRYAKIRSVASRQPIAKQVWIVYPADTLGRISDESIEWGTNTEPDEAIEGMVGVRPDARDQIPLSLLRFVKSLLTFRGLGDVSVDQDAWDQVPL